MKVVTGGLERVVDLLALGSSIHFKRKHHQP